MPVTAHDIANELRRRQPGMPTKKLHKLLYYVQGAHLVTAGRPAFMDRIAAWDMGPVVAGLWADEQHGRPTPAPSPLTEEHVRSIDAVMARYGALTGTQLENMTHNEDPWADVRSDAQTSDTITIDALREWFGGIEDYRRRTDPRLRRGLSAAMRAAVLESAAEDPIHRR